MNAKELRKAAFAVGFGFTVGKYLGNVAVECIKDAAAGVLKYFATNGNETAQRVCREKHLNYGAEEDNENEPKMKIGFHA